MKNRGAVLVLLLVVAAGAGIWWWKGRGGDHRDPAKPSITAGSAAQPSAPKPSAPAQPGQIAVTVTNAKGPIAGAMVRFAPEHGEVIAIETGADGVARATELTPGTWEISASAKGHDPAALPAHELASGANAALSITLVDGGRSLTGVVTDVSGGPIAGARIDAARLEASIRPGNAIATAITGGDGRYEIAVAEGQLFVAARSPDYAAQSRVVDVGATGATADFALVPGGVIEGIVRDDKTGEPVAGAIVLGRRDNSAAMFLAESSGHAGVAGADGKFRLGGLRPGVYELHASAQARRSKTETIVGLGVAEQASGVEILVGVGPVVRGKVVDETGAPVANATINASGQERGSGGEAKSAADGAFVLEGLQPGRYFLFARSDTHVPSRPASVEVGDRDVDGIVVTMTRGTKITGRVEPRQICEVRAEPDDADIGRMLMFLSPVTTKADGVFELPPASTGRVKLAARCGSGDQGERVIDIAPGMPEVVLEVKPGALIGGKVTDGQGKPVANATVMASEQDGGTRTMIVNGVITSGVQALTNGAGAYELRGLPAGSYRITALDRGQPMRIRGKAPAVTLGASDKKTGIDLVVDRPDGIIEGVVTGPDGKPIADAWVSVHQNLESMLERLAGEPGERGRGERRVMRVEASDDADGRVTSDFPPALTDAQGRFAITGLPHATFEVVAEAQAGKLRGRTSGVKPNAKITIPIAGVTTLSGTVRGANGPVALFTVELDGPTRAQRAFTDGKFELGRVDPGSYVVRVQSADGNAEAKVEVKTGTPATVDITLAANAVVAGTIVDGAGKPVAGVPVTVVDDTGPGVRVSLSGPPPTSGPDGKFRVEHKAGLAVLIVLGGKPVTKRGLKLEAGKTLDVGNVALDGAPPGP
jgi:protocatechuate 3,4-dioxygenase beta subunit